MYLWDEFLPQAQIILNLLTRSNIYLQLLAYAHMNGNFIYDTMPRALVGTKVVVYNTADKRKRMGNKGEDG